jgi:hypothetical protein
MSRSNFFYFLLFISFLVWKSEKIMNRRKNIIISIFSTFFRRKFNKVDFILSPTHDFHVLKTKKKLKKIKKFEGLIKIQVYDYKYEKENVKFTNHYKYLESKSI